MHEYNRFISINIYNFTKENKIIIQNICRIRNYLIICTIKDEILGL